jgi:hypothetical protein
MDLVTYYFIFKPLCAILVFTVYMLWVNCLCKSKEEDCCDG